MTKTYCEHCKKLTEHREVVKQKPSEYGNSRKEKIKAFLGGFFSGWGGSGLAWLDHVDHYAVCDECGGQKKEIFGECLQ